MHHCYPRNTCRLHHRAPMGELGSLHRNTCRGDWLQKQWLMLREHIVRALKSWRLQSATWPTSRVQRITSERSHYNKTRASERLPKMSKSCAAQLCYCTTYIKLFMIKRCFLLLLAYLYFLFMVTLTAYAFTDPSVFLPCVKTLLLQVTLKM